MFEFLNSFINVYNNLFFIILAIIFIVLFGIGFNFHSRKNDSDEKWGAFIYVIKKKFLELMMIVVLFAVLIYFVNNIFSISIFQISNILYYSKIIIGIILMKIVSSGKHLYSELNYINFLQQVKKGKYSYTTPNNILTDLKSRYHMNYELQVERLGILKSMTPISLTPLIAGYIIEGKEINVNWNTYTIIFFSLILVYIYSMWRCYSDIRLWKLREFEIEKELRQLPKE